MSEKLQERAIHSPFKTIECDNVSFTVSAEAADVINVAMKLKNGDDSLTQRVGVFAYLSDDANGDTLTATAPSGGIAIQVDGALVQSAANKSFDLVSETNGNIDINIPEAGAATWFLVIVLPSGGLLVSPAIAFV